MCHDDCPRPVSGGEAISEATVEIALDSGALPAFIVTPDHKPGPAILLIHDINGANDFYHDVARRLALAGYVVALPDFFFRQGPLTDSSREAKQARMHALEQSQTLADVRTALLWLQKHEGTTGKVGTIGFCMGGTLAMLAASRDPAADAAVVFYGFPNRDRTPTAPLLPSDEDEAVNLLSPMLGFWGTEDIGVGMENVDNYDAQLKRYAKPHTFVKYDGVGHGFLTFEEDAPAAEASKDAWAQTLRFLKKRLGGSDAS